MAVASFLRATLRPPVIWSAFPAGGGGRLRGAFLKAMGLQAGWPDLIVMAPAGHYETRVLGIELKAGKGKLSEAQLGIVERFLGINARIITARSIEEVELALRMSKIPLHVVDRAMVSVARAG
jgi:hypothetical protein